MVDDKQGDLFGAPAARDAALKRVKDNAGQWMAAAWGAALAVAKEQDGRVVTGEDFRLAIRNRIPRPHHHNVWGAFIRDLAKAEILIDTKETANMRTKKSHARRTPVYRVRAPV